MITRTEILYAYGRLQEQDDLPENCNDFMLAASLEKLDGNSKQYGFYQVCPKCGGSGEVLNEPYPTLTAMTKVCPVCNGAKLLVRPEITDKIK